MGRQPTMNLKVLDQLMVLFCLFFLFICVVVDKAVQHVGTQGYVLGNPLTDHEIDTNSIVPFAHLKALISDKLYEVTSLS